MHTHHAYACAWLITCQLCLPLIAVSAAIKPPMEWPPMNTGRGCCSCFESMISCMTIPSLPGFRQVQRCTTSNKLADIHRSVCWTCANSHLAKLNNVINMLLHVHRKSMQFDLVGFASAVPLCVVRHHVQALLSPELVHCGSLPQVDAGCSQGAR